MGSMVKLLSAKIPNIDLELILRFPQLILYPVGRSLLGLIIDPLN